MGISALAAPVKIARRPFRMVAVNWLEPLCELLHLNRPKTPASTETQGAKDALAKRVVLVGR